MYSHALSPQRYCSDCFVARRGKHCTTRYNAVASLEKVLPQYIHFVMLSLHGYKAPCLKVKRRF